MNWRYQPIERQQHKKLYIIGGKRGRIWYEKLKDIFSLDFEVMGSSSLQSPEGQFARSRSEISLTAPYDRKPDIVLLIASDELAAEDNFYRELRKIDSQNVPVISIRVDEIKNRRLKEYLGSYPSVKIQDFSQAELDQLVFLVKNISQGRSISLELPSGQKEKKYMRLDRLLILLSLVLPILVSLLLFSTDFVSRLLPDNSPTSVDIPVVTLSIDNTAPITLDTTYTVFTSPTYTLPNPSPLPSPTWTVTPQPTLTPLPELFAPSNNNEWIPIEYKIGNEPVVYVPSGCFDQGTSFEEVENICNLNENEACLSEQYYNESPLHTVCLQAFLVSKYEISQDLYFDSKFEHDDSLPVTQITWEDADEFCRSKGGYLPTESQWEYAARGVNSLIYTYGNEFQPEHHVVDDESVMPVMSVQLDISWVGAIAMNGNVREWVYDSYDTAYYETSPLENPTGPSSDSPLKVVRGGNWSERSPIELRLAVRDQELFDSAIVDLGFRCAYPISVSR